MTETLYIPVRKDGFRAKPERYATAAQLFVMAQLVPSDWGVKLEEGETKDIAYSRSSLDIGLSDAEQERRAELQRKQDLLA